MKKRTGNPFLVVECKAAHISLSSDIFSQVAVYNYCIDAPFVMITNGMQLGIFEKRVTKQTENNLYKMIENLPIFEKLPCHINQNLYYKTIFYCNFKALVIFIIFVFFFSIVFFL
nr:type I restriction enzyme HsdR N-terminal domain-containing protein [Bernardetia litoralis]